MNTRRLWAGLAGLAALTVLSACGTSGQQSSPSTGSSLQVVAAVYPYQWLAEQIGGNRVAVESLVQPGADSHDLELTPRQVADITQKADLVLYEKHLVAPVDDAVASGTRGKVLDTTALVPEKDTSGGHAASTDQAHADPHVWLDPTLLVPIAQGVRDQLSAIDPSGTTTYAANADKVVADLQALDGEFSTGLAHCDRKVFITSHEAFGYLAERYGLQQVAVRGIDSSVEPSAARIAEVQNIAKQNGVTTIFTETAVSPAVSEAIARDAGLRTDVLDPIESQATDTSRGSDYPSRMRSDLAALRTANGCR